MKRPSLSQGKILLFFLGMASAISAHAVVSSHYLDPNSAPDSVCFISFHSFQNGNPLQNLAGCTGTLIRPNRVLTAAHCLDHLRQGDFADVTCAKGKRSFSVNGYEGDPEYSNNSANGGEDLHDVAILDIHGKHSPTPMALASTQEEVDSLLKTPQNCILYGYGRGDDENDNSWGLLRAAVIQYITPEVLKSRLGWDEPFDIYQGPDTHAAPGDSGGPIVCKRPDGSFVEIATTMTRVAPFIAGTSKPDTSDFMSVHEAIWFNIDWINSTTDLPRLSNQ